VSQYSTVAGISSTLPDTTQLFNEYRVGDGLDGRSSEAAIGLRRLWKLGNGIGLSASLQRIAPLAGVVSDESNAVALGPTTAPPRLESLHPGAVADFRQLTQLAVHGRHGAQARRQLDAAQPRTLQPAD